MILELVSKNDVDVWASVYTNKNVTQQNVSLALALSEMFLDEKGACRVHGGGFAGTVQAFVPTDMLDAFKEGIETVFGKDSCHVLSVRSAGGIRMR